MRDAREAWKEDLRQRQPGGGINDHLQISNRFKLPTNPYGIHGTKSIIYLHEWLMLMFMVNVGKYTSPMDGMGKERTPLKNS